MLAPELELLATKRGLVRLCSLVLTDEWPAARRERLALYALVATAAAPTIAATHVSLPTRRNRALERPESKPSEHPAAIEMNLRANEEAINAAALEYGLLELEQFPVGTFAAPWIEIVNSRGEPMSCTAKRCAHEWASGDKSCVSTAGVCLLCHAIAPADPLSEPIAVGWVDLGAERAVGLHDRRRRSAPRGASTSPPGQPLTRDGRLSPVVASCRCRHGKRTGRPRTGGLPNRWRSR